MNEPNTPEAETRAEIDDKPRSSKYWLAEISAAKRRDEPFHNAGRKVVKKYRDEREREGMGDSAEQKLNILWANTEVLVASLFASLGKPDVRRRYPKPGRAMKVAKQVAIVLENALNVSIDRDDEEYEMGRAVRDMLLPGRGQCWTELESEDGEDGYVKKVSCKAVHVAWEDYIEGAGARWGDKPWVGRGLNYTRDDLKRLFPAHGAKIPLNCEADGYTKQDRQADNELFKRARVYEIWDKNRKERVYVAEDYEFILKADKDPYRLEHFYPCPRPLISVETTDSARPIPEYTLYQDQAEELNRITTRIFKLINMLKVRGVYDATADDHEKLANLMYAADGEFLPYKGAAALLQKGGLDGAFFFFPIEDIIQALQQLYAQRDQLIQSIYEVTGISDIVRGATDPRETKGAQQLKAQFGSMRLQKRQKEVQRFVRDFMRIKAELMAEHYPREQLEEMTGIPMPTKAQQDQAKQFLAMIEAQKAQSAAMAGPPGGGASPGSGRPQLAPPPQGAMPAGAPGAMAA